MKRLLGLTLVATAWTFGRHCPRGGARTHPRDRVRRLGQHGHSAHCDRRKFPYRSAGDTKYLTEARSDLDHISAGSYVGVAAKNVGDKLVALDVLIFPPS